MNRQTYVGGMEMEMELWLEMPPFCHITICTRIQINASGTLQAPRLGPMLHEFQFATPLRAGTEPRIHVSGLIYATKRKQTFKTAIKSQDAMFNCRTASASTKLTWRTSSAHTFSILFAYEHICAWRMDGVPLPCHISISICHLTHPHLVLLVSVSSRLAAFITHIRASGFYPFAPLPP